MQLLRHDERDRLSDRLLRRVSVNPFGALVPARDRPVQAHGEDGVLGGPDDGGQALGHRFGPAPLREVADECRERRLAVGPKRCHRELDRELAAVAPERGEFDPLSQDRPFAGRLEPLHPPTVGVAIVRGNQCFFQGATQDLRLRPSEHPFGLAAPPRDAAPPVHDDHGVERALEDQAVVFVAPGQLPGPLRDLAFQVLLRVPRQFFGEAPLRDVGDGPDVSLHPPRAVAFRLRLPQDPGLFAVRPDESILGAEDGVLLRGSVPLVKDSRAILGVEGDRPALARRLLRGEARDFTPTIVDPKAVPGGVCMEEAHGGKFRDRVVERSAFLGVPGMPKQVDEDAHLGAQGIGIDGLADEIHGTECVRLRGLFCGGLVPGDEDDRHVAGCLPASDEAGGLEAVHAGHADIQEDARAFIVQEVPQAFFAGAGENQSRAEIFKGAFKGDQIVGPIIDQNYSGGAGPGGEAGSGSLGVIPSMSRSHPSQALRNNSIRILPILINARKANCRRST